MDKLPKVFGGGVIIIIIIIITKLQELQNI